MTAVGPDGHPAETAAVSHQSLVQYPHRSRRSAIVATGGVVATSQPLAAQAGLEMLAKGGNAIDAAIAAAAALTVVEPCSNGLGSDAFALVWDRERLHGFNGSGRWPMAADLNQARDAGAGAFPDRGWIPVTVPGAVDTWDQLHQRWGSMPVGDILAPALGYATDGHPVSPVVAQQWTKSFDFFTQAAHQWPEVAGWAEVFGRQGRAPEAGERWTSPAHARGLRSLAERGLRDFYEGEVAEATADYAAATGGWMTADDLSGHRGEWVAPIGVPYRDHEVWEIPPNGQGIAALLALGMLDHHDLRASQLDPLSWHRQIEAMKLAFVDSDAHVGDEAFHAVPVAGLLDSRYLAERAQLITDRAGPAPRGEPNRGGTVYLCTADDEGRMVSFIQSNYMGFGSGVVVPSHGIAMQNRAAGFTLEAGHPNEAAPNKRPRHTIIPGFLTRDGRAVGPFGVMGGEMQPQGHLQVVSAMIDHGLNPQAALDGPRWYLERDGRVRVEQGVGDVMVDGLRARGHEVIVEADPWMFGRGQIIARRADGVYVAGSEPRADGCAVGR